jgi:hypothetical protein
MEMKGIIIGAVVIVGLTMCQYAPAQTTQIFQQLSFQPTPLTLVLPSIDQVQLQVI